MSVYLDDLDGGSTVRLHGAGHGPGDSSTEASSDPLILPIITRASDEAIAVQLTGEQQVSVGGVATTDQAGGSISNLGSWASSLLSRVDGTQGSGYRIRSEYRGRSFEGILESIRYEREMGSPDKVQWDVTLQRGQSFMPLEPQISAPSGTPSDSASIDGYDLGYIRQQTEEISQEVTNIPLILHDMEEQPVIPTSGAVREIQIQGTLDGSESSRRSFDEHMDSRFSEFGTVEYNSAFPGYSLTCQITDYDSVREAGTTAVGEYQITLIESIPLPDFDLPSP